MSKSNWQWVHDGVVVSATNRIWLDCMARIAVVMPTGAGKLRLATRVVESPDLNAALDIGKRKVNVEHVIGYRAMEEQTLDAYDSDLVDLRITVPTYHAGPCRPKDDWKADIVVISDIPNPRFYGGPWIDIAYQSPMLYLAHSQAEIAGINFDLTLDPYRQDL